jgi:hypothetical protein
MGCSGAAPPHVGAPVDPARAPWARPAKPTVPRNDEVATLMRTVSRQRRLVPRELPGLASVGREELVARAVALSETLEARAEPGAPRAGDVEALLLHALELVPAEFDREAATRAALEAHLQAFYDPLAREVVIDRALESRLRRRVLAHELVHALADQHFDLGARLAAPDESADARSALLTVAEGDAEALVRELWPSSQAAIGGAAVADAAETSWPPVLARALAAPYVDGASVVQRARGDGGWPTVDALYRRRDGTLALLEPAAEGAPPAGAVESPAPPPGFSWAFSDVLGAQAWRVVLEEWLPEPEARQIASGWTGDRLTLYEGERRQRIVWEVRSTAKHALAAARALQMGLGLIPRSGAGSASDAVCRPHRDGGVVAQRRRGDSVLVAFATDAQRDDDSVPASDTCSALSEWLTTASTDVSQRQTRVCGASPVCPDPTRAGTDLDRDGSERVRGEPRRDLSRPESAPKT